MAGFTKGPWTIIVHDYSMAGIYPLEEEFGDMSPVLCFSPCKACQGRIKDSVENEGKMPSEISWKWGKCLTPSLANAHLISAAPDMYDVLDRLVKLDEVRASLHEGLADKIDTWAADVNVAYMDAKSALRKARGEA